MSDILEPIRQSRSALQQRQSHLDPALLNVSGALAATGNEPDAIIAFAKEKIGYAPYLGSMLGADGVASTRRGNALDQSLFLATMMGRAGHEARIVGAPIDQTLADRLLAQWLSAPDEVPLPYSVGTASAQSIAGLIATLPSESASAHEEQERGAAVRERAEGYALAVASAAGVDLSPRDSRADLRRIAADYHWVQYRDAPFSDWVDVHPAFGPAGLGDEAAPAPASHFTGNLPDSLLHRVTIRGHIDRLIGGKEQRQAITSAWTAPVSNLGGRPISFTIVPLDPPGGEEFDAAKVFMPFINGQRAPGAHMFDRKGNVIDMGILDMGAPGSMVDLILTMSEKGASAAGLLAGLDFGTSEGDAPIPESAELLRVVVTVTIDGPGGARTHERILFDRAEANGEIVEWDEISLSQMLYRNLSLLVDAGFAAPARRYEAILSDIDRRLASIEFDIVNWDRPPSQDLDRQRFELVGADPTSLGLVHAAFSLLGSPQLMLDSEQHIAAPVTPSIIGVHASPMQTGDELSLRTVIDIISIDWAAWRKPAHGASSIMREPAVMASFGALATVQESELADAAKSALPEGFATRSSAWLSLDAPLAGMARVTEPTNFAMAADIKRGNRVVALDTGDGGGAAWWSVDPRNGLVVGMTPQGGASMLEWLTENIIAINGLLMSLYFTHNGLKACNDHPRPDCCVWANLGAGLVIGGFSGLGIGLIAGMATASTALGTAGLQIYLASQMDLVAGAAMPDLSAPFCS